MNEYHVSSTSRDSAVISDQVIDLDEERSEGSGTRKIARLQIVRRSGEPSTVKLRICHQRRHSQGEPWEDADNFNLIHARSGKEVQMILSSAQTHRLLEILLDGSRIADQREVYRGDHRYAVVDLDEHVVLGGRTRDVLRGLVERHGEDFWGFVSELGPDLPETLALRRINESRSAAIQDFEGHLRDGDWSESQWHAFFKENTWIFGYGLSYQFLQDLQDEPDFGGQDVSGRGSQHGDFIMATAARTSFTVIVEIKTPGKDLVTNRTYRNGAHQLGNELTGGVVQVQQQCQQWMQQSQTTQNRESLEDRGIYTHEPKGILVIGNTESLSDGNRRRTFESFRRRITNPEILTFDELLERARYIASSGSAENQEEMER